jgi:hypothetical protein
LQCWVTPDDVSLSKLMSRCAVDQKDGVEDEGSQGRPDILERKKEPASQPAVQSAEILCSPLPECNSHNTSHTGSGDERAAATLAGSSTQEQNRTVLLLISTSLEQMRDSSNLANVGLRQSESFGAFGFGSCGCRASLRMAFVAVHVGCGFHSEESEAELRKVQQSRQLLLPLPGVALQAACLFAHHVHEPTNTTAA